MNKCGAGVGLCDPCGSLLAWDIVFCFKKQEKNMGTRFITIGMAHQ